MRLDVDVGSTLVECVLPEPVDDVDDVLIVRVEMSVTAQLDQLLEVAGEREFAARVLLRLFHRAREIEEFADVAPDVGRVGEDQLDVELQDARELVGPRAHERLAGRDRECHAVDCDRQDPVAFRVRIGHRCRDGAELDLQRIDVAVRDAQLAGEPFDQRLEQQHPVRSLERLELLFGDQLQRMLEALRA